MPTISIAGHGDIPALEKLVNSAYRGESSKKGWTTEADFIDGIRANAEMLAEMIDNPKGVILKSSDEAGNIEGCVYLEQTNNNKLYLGLLTVSPEIQAKGLGKLLMDEASDYAIRKKLIAIYMFVLSVRPELIAWYERRGYQKTGEVKQFKVDTDLIIPRQQLELLVMEKKV
jgi:ribosomal protein S18 acetylase RimI-like enzyme